MNILVGCTGFVGSNLFASGKYDAGYHASDIEKAYGTNPELLVYAGLRAEKYLANTAPEKDYEQVLAAWENIQKIAPKKLVLISTVDVLKDPRGMDENSEIITKDLHPYGLNRYRLEEMVRRGYPDALIIRLPGLYGINLKKNFIYDCIHRIPFMLKKEKLTEICSTDSRIQDFYELQDNGFYKVKSLDAKDEIILKEILDRHGFSAVNFTDSRNVYQFYPLARLQKDLETCLKEGITLWHPATEPIGAGELYRYVYGKEFVNETLPLPVAYDFRTKHASIFTEDAVAKEGYIMSKQELLADIKKYIEEA